MVDKTLRMNLLFDFYGQLLTDRQRHFFEMYYADDLSLGEIAEHFDVSRQAVYDIIKRSARALENFESRLGLCARHEKDQEHLSQLHESVQQLRSHTKNLSGLSDEERSWLDSLGHKLEQLVRQIRETEE